jgi:polyhydroxyalkanoate synthesis regulator protein
VQKQVNTSFGGIMPPALEEMQRQQMAMFDKAVSMFNPLTGAMKTENAEEPPTPAQSDDDLSDLRQQIAALQNAVESLAKKG